MARVLRTPVAPGNPVAHRCRNERGKAERGIGRSNQLCRKCNTWLVYVRSNTTSRRR